MSIPPPRVLVTERTELRPAVRADLDARYLGWLSDPEVTRWLLGVGREPATDATADAFFARFADASRNRLFMIRPRGSETPIGTVTLNNIDLVDRKADTGLMIGDKAYWGQGFATEVWAAVLTYAFEDLGLRKVIAGAAAENVGSLRALERLGFREEGRYRDEFWLDGAFRDGLRLGVFRDGFQAASTGPHAPHAAGGPPVKGRPRPDPAVQSVSRPPVHEIRIGPHVIGRPGRTLFVVEENNANNGDLALALEMIGLAAEAGADAIEFQLVIADDFYVPDHPLHPVFKAREFDDAALRRIASTARDHGLLVCAAPLSTRLVAPLVEHGFDFFNINSSDITNPRMLDAVADAGLPFFVSTAMARLDEIDWAVDRLKRRGATAFGLYHGQHVMATDDGHGVPPEHASLATLRYLRDRHGVPVGFIDHTQGSDVAPLAVGHGAAVVTKHLAPEAGWKGPDWMVALPPDEMAACIRGVRMADAAVGSPEKAVLTAELADRKAMRRSIVASKDLSEGTVLTAEHLALKRPGTGIDGMELEHVYGRTLRAALAKDQQLAKEHLS